jgi:hypothetical protein
VTLASDVNLLVEGSRRVLGAMRGSLGGGLGARAKP